MNIELKRIFTGLNGASCLKEINSAESLFQNGGRMNSQVKKHEI